MSGISVRQISEPYWQQKPLTMQFLKFNTFSGLASVRFITRVYNYYTCIQFSFFSEQNVLPVVSIAEKYLSSAVVKKCKDVMEQILKMYSSVEEEFSLEVQPSKMLQILKVIVKTSELNYENLTTIGTQSMGIFNSNVYSGSCSKERMSGMTKRKTWRGKSGSTYHFDESKIQLLTECRALFASLPVNVQNKIHRARALELEKDWYFVTLLTRSILRSSNKCRENMYNFEHDKVIEKKRIWTS